MRRDLTRRFGRTAGPAAAILAAALLAAPPGYPQEPQERTVTLEEAVERALQAHPQMAEGRAAVATAAASERTATWGAWLPSLSVSSGASLASQERFNPQTNTTAIGSQSSYRAGISGSVDLFTGGRRTAEMTRARAETAAAEAGLVEARFAVALAAQRAFFDVLRADDLIRVAELRVERARAGVAAAEERLAVGAATRSDVLRATLELNQARQALLEARTGRRTAAFALGRVVGVDGPVGARADGPPAVEPLSLSREEIVDLVERTSPSVRSAQTAVEAAAAGIRSARAQYLPTLRLSGGSDWFNQQAALDGGRSSWSAGIGLSFPLFNGFEREAQVARARSQASVAQIRLRDVRRAARAEAERLLSALRLAEEQLVLAEEAVEVAREDLRVVEERYRIGAATILDRITSQVNLDDAERALVAARYDYQIARAELEALAGRTL